MINDINKLYKQEVDDNKDLKLWIDELADFILSEHYKMTYVDNEQWAKRKMEIIKDICKIGEEINGKYREGKIS